MDATPVISVIVPTYNDPQRVVEAVQSIREQDFDALEVLVIDDGSSAVVQKEVMTRINALQDQRIRVLLSSKNRGPARTRNIGVRLARGRFLGFLDCDDLWRPGKLNMQLSHMEKQDAALSCTSYENLNEATGKRSLRQPPERIVLMDLFGRSPIGCSTVILDRKHLGRSYFPDFPMRQDLAHWLSILRLGHKAVGVPQVYTIRRVHGRSLSANKLRAAWFTWRVYREEGGFGVAGSLGHFIRYAVLSVIPTKRS